MDAGKAAAQASGSFKSSSTAESSEFQVDHQSKRGNTQGSGDLGSSQQAEKGLNPATVKGQSVGSNGAVSRG